MVGIAVLMLGIVAGGLLLLWRGRVDSAAWYLRLCQLSAPLGFIAVIAGWTTTEVGRQPWTVYGLLRTADSVSPSLTGFDVLLSLLLYMAVYLIIYPVGLGLMLRIVRAGPGERAPEAGTPIAGGHPQAPIQALSPAADGAAP
jgi:cytochrome d ubiquinol oxidase subunit I